MSSSTTPLTDALKRQFEQLNSHNSSTNSSATISPRGVGGQQQSYLAAHSQPRGGSPMSESNEQGVIFGVAVTDGASCIPPDSHGAVFEGGSIVPQLKYLGGVKPGGSSNNTSYSSNYDAPQFAAAGGGGGGGNNQNNSFFSTSGINLTPRNEVGGAGFVNSAAGPNQQQGNNNNNNNRGGMFSGAVGGPSGGARNLGGRRNVPQQQQQQGQEGYDFKKTYDDNEEYDDDEEEDEEEDYDDEGDDQDDEDDEFDSDEEEPDVLPGRYQPKVTTGALRGKNRGLGHFGASSTPGGGGGNNGDEEEGRASAGGVDKSEFVSFDIVTSLLAVSGQTVRRDLLEYHSPLAFLQFLEQMMCGAYFIRFHPRHGTPHERYVYLRMIEVEPGVERPFFCQCKHATAVQIDDCVAVADLVGVVAGGDSPAFQRQLVSNGFVEGSFVGARRQNFSTKGALSLYFYDRKRKQMPRSLDILTTNMTVFRLWKLSCEALVAVNTCKMGPHARSAAQHMRAYFVAAMRAIKEASRVG